MRRLGRIPKSKTNDEEIMEQMGIPNVIKTDIEIIDEYISKTITKDDLPNFKKFAKKFLKVEIKAVKTFVSIYLKKKLKLFNYRKVHIKDLAMLVAAQFFNKETFSSFCKSLPKNHKEIYLVAVWKTNLNIQSIMRKYRINVVEHYQFSNNQPLINEFTLFKYVSYNKSISLIEFIATHLKTFMKMPEGASINSVEKKSVKAKYSYKVNHTPDWFVQYVQQFFLQGHYATKKGGLVTKKTLRKFIEQANMDNFPGIDDSYLAQEMTLLFAQNFFSDYENTNKNFKNAFIKYFRGNVGDFIIEDKIILNHLNSGGVSISSTFRDILNKIINKMPIKDWVSYSNIQNYCEYMSYDSDNYFGYSFVSIRLKNIYGKNGYIYYINDTYRTDPDLVFFPLLKGCFFLMATLGLVEITYDEPQNSVYRRDDALYLTPFDSLKGVRITKFGAFVLGRVKKYSPPKNKQNQTIINFSKSSLIIELDKPDILKEMQFSKFTKKLTPTTYEVSYKTMLSNCNTKADFKFNITLLKDVLGENAPQIWKDFIAELEIKNKQIKRKLNYEVFQLGDYKDLLYLITRDIVLKKLIYKSENKMVLVKEDNFKKFKNRLKEFGYFF